MRRLKIYGELSEVGLGVTGLKQPIGDKVSDKSSHQGRLQIIAKTPQGETPHMKAVGMLVVSLRAVNFAFWSHLGCSGQNAIIFSREGLV